jgi:hypothetical protein
MIALSGRGLIVLLLAAWPACAGGAGAGGSAASVIPQGARWTIYCAAFNGPGHAENARAVRDQMLRQTKLGDWYIVQTAGSSTLYYGYYREIDEKTDAAEAARAAADRRAIGALTDAAGARIFPLAVVMPLDQPDPWSRPEWDLRNARGYWSLQIAAMRDRPDRRRLVAEAVEELRKQGIEAYYLHGPALSAICVGAFPENAVRVSEGTPNTDPNVPVFVTEAFGALPQYITAADGRLVQVQQPKAEAVDPALRRLIAEFATLTTDSPEGGSEGRIVIKDGRQVLVPNPSFLVRIPREGAVASTGAASPSNLPPSVVRQAGGDALPVGPAAPGGVASSPPVPAPVRPAGSGAGAPPRLRGLDDF